MMTRSILLVAAGIFSAVLFACVQTPSPPPARTSVAANCTFNASSVGVLAPRYFPDPDSNTYSSPGQNLQAGSFLSPQMLNDINAAFTNAPLPVQNDICALSGIFIDTSSCQGGTINPCTPVDNKIPVSWGYRSYNKNKPDAGSMYIAIPATLWPAANAAAIPLSQYEQSVVQFFAQNAGNANWSSGGAYPLPTISNVSYSNSDTSWPTVLAALAHELGHVKFNYTIHKKNNYGKDYDFSALNSCNISGVTDFFNWWTYNGNGKKLIPKGYWRHLGRQDNVNSNARIDHSLSPYLSDFQDLTQNPNSLLYALYAGQVEPWASFWGAWSPDEDFVETYVLLSLLNNMQSLQISIPGYSPYDIIANTTQDNKPILYGKIQCVANLPTIGSITTSLVQ
jgi:hypothetical protein